MYDGAGVQSRTYQRLVEARAVHQSAVQPAAPVALGAGKRHASEWSGLRVLNTQVHLCILVNAVLYSANSNITCKANANSSAGLSRTVNTRCCVHGPIFVSAAAAACKRMSE